MKLSIELLEEICNTLQLQIMITVSEFNEMNEKINQIEFKDDEIKTEIAETMIFRCVKEVFKNIMHNIGRNKDATSNSRSVSWCKFSEAEYSHDNIMISEAILNVLTERLNGMIINQNVVVNKCVIEVSENDDNFEFRFEIYYRAFDNEENNYNSN